MLALSDVRWESLIGGYRTLYDPRAALRMLAGGDADTAWRELWDGLHHQGDVDEASYAAVPHLVRVHGERGVADWNTCALVALIELLRHRGSNPPLPEWLRVSYDAAWTELSRMALRDLETSNEPRFVTSALDLIALSKGLPHAAEMLLDFDDDEMRDVMRHYDAAR